MTFDIYGKKAIETVMEGKSLFITGKAGTGKTYLLKEILPQEISYVKIKLVLAHIY